MFEVPEAMVIHASLAAQRLQNWSTANLPYVLAGDFNFKPGSPMHTLYLTGVANDNVPGPLFEGLYI